MDDSTHLETKPEESPRGYKWVYVEALIYGLDTTIAADIQAAITKRSDSVDQLTWIGTGFPLGSVRAILPAAAFYAVFDLKVLSISSLVLFDVVWGALLPRISY